MLLCGEIHSKPYSDEDYDPIFSMEEVSVDGIVTVVRCCTLSFSERNVPFPGVHLKQDYTPRLHTLLYEIALYQYQRKRLIAMTNAIKLKTE